MPVKKGMKAQMKEQWRDWIKIAVAVIICALVFASVAPTILNNLDTVPGNNLTYGTSAPVARAHAASDPLLANTSANTYGWDITTFTMVTANGLSRAWTGPVTLSAGRTYNGTITFSYNAQMSMYAPGDSSVPVNNTGTVWANLTYGPSVYVWQHVFNAFSAATALGNLSIAPSWTVTAPAQHTPVVNITVNSGTSTWSSPPHNLVVHAITGTGVDSVNNNPNSKTYEAVPFIWGYRHTYTTTFTESGLPSGDTWYVNMSASSGPLTGTSYSVNLLNGSYAFTIASLNKSYSASPQSGTFTVAGSSVSETITFALVTYTVAFSESGLPSSTTWYVNLTNGQTFSSTTTSISFPEPNGTYYYSVATINKDYKAVSYPGSFIVSGSTVNTAIVFSAYTYNVSFGESGLPTNTIWSVTLNGVTKSSGSNLIIFDETNGTYSYTIGSINDYVAEPASGSISVSGAATSVFITYSFVYHVTFNDNGLPSGTSWTITFNGVQQSSSTSSIVFNSPTGTFSYSVGSIQYFAAQPSSGSVDVIGNTSVQINFVHTYVITFIASGLPSGTKWTVNYGGTIYSATTGSGGAGTEINVTVLQGSVQMYIIATGYYSNPPAYNNYIGSNQTVKVAFTPAASSAFNVFANGDLMIFIIIFGGVLTVVVILLLRRRH